MTFCISSRFSDQRLFYLFFRCGNFIDQIFICARNRGHLRQLRDENYRQAPLVSAASELRLPWSSGWIRRRRGFRAIDGRWKVAERSLQRISSSRRDLLAGCRQPNQTSRNKIRILLRKPSPKWWVTVKIMRLNNANKIKMLKLPLGHELAWNTMSLAETSLNSTWRDTPFAGMESLDLVLNFFFRSN